MAKTMRLPSVMPPSQRFAQVPGVSIQRSVFDRSHGHKLTFDAGYLVPIYVDDVIPGDTFHMSMTGLVRLTTPLKPLMDNMYFETFFFFVPYRLVWSNFQKFMGEQLNPGDSISFTVPVLGVSDFAPNPGSLIDYLGGAIPGKTVGSSSPSRPSALPCRAANLIYNQWFRDENLINSLTVPLTDGPDGVSNYVLQKRGKRHDYFTSCLPFLQKGLAVSLPLGDRATVRPEGFIKGTTPPYTTSPDAFPEWKDSQAATNAGSLRAAGGGTNSAVQMSPNWGVNQGLRWSNPKLEVDLSTATAATINDIRQAFQIQKLLERDARGGTRYTEIIRSHFGVVSPDARLQRAEYLGGGSTPVVVNPVAQQTQTGVTGGSTPLGNLAGVGVATAFGHGFNKSFTEHGVIIGFANVRADLTYQQGVERYWYKQTRYDFYWPEFAHIGEQAVLNREIWYTGGAGGGAAADTNVFGYQERYAEYRYKPSRISGLFRSDVAGTLDLWHLSEDFAALPTLGQTFIEDQTSSILVRNVAVPAEPDFFADLYFKLRCARPMPVFGVPGFVDHF